MDDPRTKWWGWGRPEDQPQFLVEPRVSEAFEIAPGKEIQVRFRFSR